jgi:hydroxymethylpyrimidine pyrophosphatase-like HAD family hydrolase
MDQNNIWIFDIDGTLAESGKQIDSEMINLLHKLKENTKGQIALCGGGTFDKIVWQSKAQTNPGLYDYIFAECGCDYRVCQLEQSDKAHQRCLRQAVCQLEQSDKEVWNEYTYQIVKQTDIRVHQMYKQIGVLIKHSLKFLSQQDYNLGGHMIDIRKGLVYVSLIGMSATDEERAQFIQLDLNQGIRSKLLSELRMLNKSLGCEDKIDIMIGGAVGISILPVENDKTQILDLIGSKFKSINYFGDKYRPGGNDHKIMSNPLVKAWAVDTPTDTKKLILDILGPE